MENNNQTMVKEAVHQEIKALQKKGMKNALMGYAIFCAGVAVMRTTKKPEINKFLTECKKDLVEGFQEGFAKGYNKAISKNK